MKLSLVAPVTLALLLPGCPSKEEGAKEHFSQDFTCPEDRVEVRARPDVKPSDAMARSVPPKDIAADPARLKMWQAKEDAVRESADSYNDIFEARGCGKETLYGCHRHNRQMNVIMCSSTPYPPGVAKW